MASALGVVGVSLLTACNPTSQPVSNRSSGPANTSVTYTGPAEAWLQMRVNGTDGFGVRFRAGVPGVPPRTCAEASNGGSMPCDVVGDYLASSYHYPETDAPGTFWPTVHIRSGEWASLMVECTYAMVVVNCPATTEIEARTVNDAGELTGDLANGMPA